jgi:hypothetical protein
MLPKTFILGGEDRVARDRRDLVERGPGEAADLIVDAGAVDQRAVAVVEPRFGGFVGGAGVGIVGEPRGERGRCAAE